MIPKKALIFDFGGVLLDWNPRHLYKKLFNGDSDALENFLNEVDFNAWNLELDKGHSFSDGVSELSARYPQYTMFIQAFHARWQETIRGPIQATIDMLQPLKTNGYSLYGLTNWSAEKFQLVRQNYPFFDLFEYILVSGEVNLVKPDSRIFQLLLTKMNREPQDCIFIDDSLINILAAQELGFMTIHYKSPEQLKNEFLLFQIAI